MCSSCWGVASTQTHNLHQQGAERVLPSRALAQKAFTRLQDINLRYSGRDWRPACVFYSVDLKNGCLYYHFAELLLWFGLILWNRLHPGVIFHAFPPRRSIFYCDTKRSRIPGVFLAYVCVSEGDRLLQCWRSFSAAPERSDALETIRRCRFSVFVGSTQIAHISVRSVPRTTQAGVLPAAGSQLGRRD